MPVELITHPNRHPNLPPSRGVRRGLPVSRNHQALDDTYVRCSGCKGSIEDCLGVREKERVEVFSEESADGGEDSCEEDRGGASEVLEGVHYRRKLV